jgi:DNA polymerase III epsilon subunit family exonuclease
MNQVPAIRLFVAAIATGCAFAVGGVPAAAEDPAPSRAPDLPGKRTRLQNVIFVAFDTETTGFSPEKDRIVEIGAVKFKGGEVIEKASWLVNPKRKIPYWARRVHGIDDQMVQNEPTFKEVFPEFATFVEGSVLIAHNARFDISFISEETKRSGYKSPPNEVIDSLVLFKAWFPASESFSLQALAEHVKLDACGFHRAMADSMYIYSIFGMGSAQDDEVKTLGSLQKKAGGALQF